MGHHGCFGGGVGAIAVSAKDPVVINGEYVRAAAGAE
jgi:hypothetical protein